MIMTIPVSSNGGRPALPDICNSWTTYSSYLKLTIIVPDKIIISEIDMQYNFVSPNTNDLSEESQG